MEIGTLRIDIPEGCNLILGHTHFIKSVEDLYEALIESGAAIKFGIAFCEASGDRLVRSDGNDEMLIKHAEKEAMKIAAGHTFVIFIKNAYPINILNRIKNVSEVCSVYAATANPIEVVYVETQLGRAIIGVVDGEKSIGIENEEKKRWRKEFLRKLGYKR